MGRTRTYDTDAIIEAARKVFLEQGPSAPTLTIAQAAGVSEGLLFKRFGTKQKLFHAAMGIPDVDANALVAELIGTGEVPENLYKVAVEITTLLREVFPRLMMLWSSRGENLMDEMHQHRDTPSFKFIQALAYYLEEEMKLGRVAKTDPLVAARLVEGACANYVFWDIVELNTELVMDLDLYIKEMVNIIWQGLRPDTTPAAAG
jgi:AcrR family transcriptional regulator